MHSRAILGRGCCWTPAALVVALVLPPVPAAAENETLESAHALYKALRYREAYDAFREALVSPDNRPDDLTEIYRHLGILAASMGKRREAVAQFQRLLCLDPAAEVDGGLPPKVTRPFRTAQSQASEVRCFKLHHNPPTAFPPSGGLELQAELEADSLGMASGVIVAYRSDGRSSYSTLRRDGTGPLQISIAAAELPPSSDGLYYLQVVNDHGGVLLEYGSADEPVRVVAQVTAEAAPPVDPWYQNEWIWVVAGAGAAVAVVGGVVTAVVIATSSGASTVDFGPVEHEIAGGQQ